MEMPLAWIWGMGGEDGRGGGESQKAKVGNRLRASKWRAAVARRHMPNADPLLRKIDCHSLRVPDLEGGLAFYRDRLGHRLKWRTPEMAGLALPESDAELVLHAEERPQETDFLVDSAPEAARRFVDAGGTILAGPFEIRIGMCAVVADPWGNVLVLLDMSKGPLRTDAEGNVI